MSTDLRHPITAIFDDISVQFSSIECFHKMMGNLVDHPKGPTFHDLDAVLGALNDAFVEFLWKRHKEAMQDLPAIAAQLSEVSQDAAS